MPSVGGNGGQVKKMNAKQRAKYQRTWSGDNKTAVFGMVERNVGERKGRVRAYVVPFIEREFLQGGIRKNVVPGSEIHTDGHPAYRGLKTDYTRQVIDHAYEYVRGHVHTNSIESFFLIASAGQAIRLQGHHR
jgi:hypothetical protein